MMAVAWWLMPPYLLLLLLRLWLLELLPDACQCYDSMMLLVFWWSARPRVHLRASQLFRLPACVFSCVPLSFTPGGVARAPGNGSALQETRGRIRLGFIWRIWLRKSRPIVRACAAIPNQDNDDTTKPLFCPCRIPPHWEHASMRVQRRFSYRCCHGVEWLRTLARRGLVFRALPAILKRVG